MVTNHGAISLLNVLRAGVPLPDKWQTFVR